MFVAENLVLQALYRYNHLDIAGRSGSLCHGSSWATQDHLIPFWGTSWGQRILLAVSVSSLLWRAAVSPNMSIKFLINAVTITATETCTCFKLASKLSLYHSRCKWFPFTRLTPAMAIYRACFCNTSANSKIN